MVLSRPRALGARREELFILCLIEFHEKRFDHLSHAGDVTLRHDLLISRESSPRGVAISCLDCKILCLAVKKVTTDQLSDYKRGEIFKLKSSLYLRLGSRFSGGK